MNSDQQKVRNKGERDLGGGVLTQFGAASVFMLAGTLFFIFVTKTMSTGDVGSISLLLALVQLFSLLFSFGLKGAMEHYISYYIGNKDFFSVDGFISKYMKLTVLLSVLSFAVIFVLARFISNIFYHDFSHTILVRLVAVDVALAMSLNILNGITSGLQHFISGGKIYMASSLAVYGLATSFLILFHSVYWIIIGWIIGYIVGVLLYSLHINSYVNLKAKANPLPMKGFIRYSAPLFAGSLLFFGSTYIDRLIVAYFLNLSLLGIYNLALLVVQGMAFFINPLNNLLLPKFSEMYSVNDNGAIGNGVAFTSQILTMIYVPISLIIAALSPSVLILLGNSNYLPGSIPLLILMTIASVFIVQYVLVQALSGIGRTEVFLYATGLSFVANIAASFLLIPRFGLDGAAVANSLAPAVSGIVVMYFASKSGILSFKVGKLSRIWFSSFVVAGAAYLIQITIGYSIIAFISGSLMGLLLYPVLLKLTHCIERDSAIILESIFSNKIPFISNVLRMIVSP